jgi:hypothetical protein
LRRLAKKVPDERNSTRDLHRLVDIELYQTLRTVEGRIVTRPLPQHLAPAGEVQDIATVKVKEQQTAARVDTEGAERVEEEITTVIREEQYVVVLGVP